MAVKIEQVIGTLHAAEGLYNPSSHAMRGVLPETLQWYYNYKGIGKVVPIGQSTIGAYMKANVSEKIATEVARIKYFEPNGLDGLYYKEVASILLGIVYHLPALAHSVVGDALTRLGSPKQFYADQETKKRIRKSPISKQWLAELDTYSRKLGVVPVYNACWDSIMALYMERGEDDDIANRLEREGAWQRLDESCGQPTVQGVMPSITFSDDCVNSAELTFGERTGAWFRGWWSDLLGIRHAAKEPAVIGDFIKSLAVLALAAGLVFAGFWLAKRRQ